MLQSLRGIGRQAHPPEVLCSLMLQTRVFQPRLRDFHAVNGYLPPRGALRALELGWQRLVPCVSNLRRLAVCAIGGDAISGSAPRPSGTGGLQTCMGLFLSSGCFLGFAHRSLFGAGKAVLRPVAAIRFLERAEGVKGPKR